MDEVEKSEKIKKNFSTFMFRIILVQCLSVNNNHKFWEEIMCVQIF